MKHEWMTNNPPEEICKYLVTDDCECLQIATWTNEFYLGHKVIGEWHWERRSYTNVVAWMPLPHPYKSLNEVEQEIRARAIDEFAEKICTELTERSFEAMNELEFVMNVVSHDKMQEVVMEVAEQLKGGQNE